MLTSLSATRIILVDGHKWKAQRLAGQHAFSNNANLQAFGETILPKHLDTLLTPFENAIELDQVLDVQEVAYDFAMVVFGELAYDVCFAPMIYFTLAPVLSCVCPIVGLC